MLNESLNKSERKLKVSKMSPCKIVFIQKIRKDNALRIPLKIKRLGYGSGKVVEVSLRVLDDLEKEKGKMEKVPDEC